jgi:hypothetical protein
VLTKGTISRISSQYFLNPHLKKETDPTFMSHEKAMLGCEISFLTKRRSPTISIFNVHSLPFYRFSLSDQDPLVRNIWNEFLHRNRNSEMPLFTKGISLVAGDFNLRDRTIIEQAFGSSFASCFGSGRDDVYYSNQLTQKKVFQLDVGSDHPLLVVLLELEL